jgi:hypothetical protein
VATSSPDILTRLHLQAPALQGLFYCCGHGARYRHRAAITAAAASFCFCGTFHVQMHGKRIVDLRQHPQFL